MELATVDKTDVSLIQKKFVSSGFAAGCAAIDDYDLDVIVPVRYLTVHNVAGNVFLLQKYRKHFIFKVEGIHCSILLYIEYNSKSKANNPILFFDNNISYKSAKGKASGEGKQKNM